MGRAGSRSNGFCGLHGGCGSEVGGEAGAPQALAFPLLPSQTRPQPLTLLTPQLPQEGTRPASWRVLAPSMLHRSAKWVSPTPSGPNGIGQSTFR